jgi:membrane-associated phospholipid phosphatase
MTAISRTLTLPRTRERLRAIWPRWGALIVAAPAFLALEGLYVSLRGIADDTGEPFATRYFLGFDRLLGAGSTPTERLQDAFYRGHTGPLELLAFALYLAWFIFPTALTVFVLLVRRGTTYAALLFFFVFPTQPPWMALHVTGIVQTVTHATRVDTNPLAAFPSLHVARPAVAALWLRRKGMHRAAAFFGILAALIAASAVYTGQHYVVDCLASVVLVLCVDRAASRFEETVPLSAQGAEESADLRGAGL